MYLNNLSLMSLILRQALQAPAHKARKNKWRELRESWAWKPWLLRWHCLLYERWRWSCHRHSCESAKGWSHWWLFGRSFQPLIQQSWTHPLRCFTLECQPFATKRVCRNPCGHGWVYMGAKLRQRQVGNFQSQEQTRSSGLYGCHQDNTVSHQTKREKQGRKCGTICMWLVRSVENQSNQDLPGESAVIFQLGRRLSACTMRWWLWKKSTWKRLVKKKKNYLILLVKYVHKFTH